MISVLHSNNKTISILIFTSGYWRSGFFQRLFSKWAYIKKLNPVTENVNPSETKSFDIVLWEADIEFRPFEYLDPGKLFIFNYKDEGDCELIKELSEKWQLNPAGYLLMLTEKYKDEFGCLPLPFPKLIRPTFHKPKKLHKRKNDIIFLCSPTYIYMNQKKKLPYTIEYLGRTCYNQRIEWAQKLQDASMLPKNMGIVEPNIEYLKKDNIVNLFGCDPVLFKTFVVKKDFVNEMLNSKIILSPGGHSRWTYRHLEGLYYKGLVVSGELEKWNMIPQLPLDAMITIPDGQFDPLKLQKIISEIEIYQESADIGYEWICSTYKAKSFFSKPGYNPATIKSMFTYLVNWFDNRLNVN